jgi:hypothetical protein
MQVWDSKEKNIQRGSIRRDGQGHDSIPVSLEDLSLWLLEIF